jgi:hypothetical protein
VSALGRDDDLSSIRRRQPVGLQILAAVEKRFDIRLPDNELIRLRTIGRIADAVARQGAITCA